jgi:hypothetical protein
MKPPAKESPAPVGIEHVLERIGRREEDRALLEQERAVLALLDDHDRRAALHDPARGLHEVRAVRQLASLAVVQRDEVDVLDQLDEIGTAALDPEIHRVARHELRALDLTQHVELQARIDVGEKDEGRAAELRRNLRAEMREHTEVRLQRPRPS